MAEMTKSTEAKKDEMQVEKEKLEICKEGRCCSKDYARFYKSGGTL